MEYCLMEFCGSCRLRCRCTCLRTTPPTFSALHRRWGECATRLPVAASCGSLFVLGSQSLHVVLSNLTLFFWKLARSSKLCFILPNIRACIAVAQVCKRHGINHTTIQIERAGTNDLDNCSSINVVCDSS